MQTLASVLWQSWFAALVSPGSAGVSASPSPPPRGEGWGEGSLSSWPCTSCVTSMSESGRQSSREAAVPCRPRTLSVDDYVRGVLAGDRSMLARAITLIESNSRIHENQAQEVLQRLLPHTGK